MKYERATCRDDAAHSCPPSLGQLVDALQAALRPRVAVRTNHAMNPDVAVQRTSEVPLCVQASKTEHCPVQEADLILKCEHA